MALIQGKPQADATSSIGLWSILKGVCLTYGFLNVLGAAEMANNVIFGPAPKVTFALTTLFWNWLVTALKGSPIDPLAVMWLNAILVTAIVVWSAHNPEPPPQRSVQYRVGSFLVGAVNGVMLTALCFGVVFAGAYHLVITGAALPEPDPRSVLEVIREHALAGRWTDAVVTNIVASGHGLVLAYAWTEQDQRHLFIRLLQVLLVIVAFAGLLLLQGWLKQLA